MLVGALLSLRRREADPGPLDDALPRRWPRPAFDPRLVQDRGHAPQARRARSPSRSPTSPGFATFDELIISPVRIGPRAPGRGRRRLRRGAHGGGGGGGTRPGRSGRAPARAERASRHRRGPHLPATLSRSFAPERIIASPPALGRRRDRARHARCPAPAVLSLLSGSDGRRRARSPGGRDPPPRWAAHDADRRRPAHPLRGGVRRRSTPAGRVERARYKEPAAVRYPAGQRAARHSRRTRAATETSPPPRSPRRATAHRRPRRPRGRHRRHDARASRARRERAARGGRARRVDEPRDHEEGRPRRDPPRAHGGGRTGSASRTPVFSRPPPSAAHRPVRARGVRRESGARASRSASYKVNVHPRLRRRTPRQRLAGV